MSIESKIKVLETAISLLTERHWCQRAMAIDIEGDEVNYISEMPEKAVQLCMIGALETAKVMTGENIYVCADVQHANNICRQLAAWNDAEGRRKEEIIKALETTICWLRQQEETNHGT